MKVLIVGNGGREHAMAWKVAQSPLVSHTYVAPGNGGTALEANITNIDIAVDEIEKLADFVAKEQIALTIVGPEIPLALGITDLFQQRGLACFGPCKKGAQLETSKAYSKQFMQRYNIPTANYREFTDLQPAIAYVEKLTPPYVIKADGLAAGKGVVIAQDLTQAKQALTDMLQSNRFGNAGHKVVIEDFLVGEEASFMVITDGEHILPLATSQDHKARDNGDQGPNTGGMGAYSPAPIVTPEIHQFVIKNVFEPTIKGLKAEGINYCGFLYAGLMINGTNNVKVLEFNCRLGDPETQPLMMRLKSDLVELCLAALDHKINQLTTQWDSRAALGVVMCAKGYPENYRKGDIIHGIGNVTTNCGKIFHAGTKMDKDKIVTTGGRVMCATSLGDNVARAQASAYSLLKSVAWQDMYYRTDIGYRAIKKEMLND